MSELHETYEDSQPWVVYTYLLTDAEADRLGEARIRMQCCICGVEEIARFAIYGPDEPPPPETLVPGYRHPLRSSFLGQHTHPLQRTAPETWALPLRNPAAHSDVLDILRDVAEKAVRRQDDHA